MGTNRSQDRSLTSGVREDSLAGDPRVEPASLQALYPIYNGFFFDLCIEDKEYSPSVAHVFGFGPDHKDMKEIAHQLAAAPDLLRACEDCMENRGDWGGAMNAAIAKARGGRNER